MKSLAVVLSVLTVVLFVRAAGAAEDTGITSGQIAVLDVVMHSIVNMYSTNTLIAQSYTNAGISSEEATEAVSRNKAFLKVLSKYSMEIRRQSVREDTKTVQFLSKITEICTNLDLQLGAIQSYIEKGDSASLEQVQKYGAKLESMIQSMINADLD